MSRRGPTKEYSILNGAKYFADAKSQIYLIFQPILGVSQRLLVVIES